MQPLACLIGPESPEVRYQRGRTLAMLGQYGAAIAELDLPISRDASNPEAGYSAIRRIRLWKTGPPPVPIAVGI